MIEGTLLVRELPEHVIGGEIVIIPRVVHPDHHIIDAQKEAKQNEKATGHHALEPEVIIYLFNTRLIKLTILIVQDDMPLSCNSSSYNINSW